MSLDVTAYSRLRAVGKHEGGLDDYCYYDNHVHAFAYACFPASFRGIQVLDTRTAGGSTFLEGGCYEPTEQTEMSWFSVGYGGHFAWRIDLARQFNPSADGGTELRESDPDKPFHELIWFADNEGCIGPEAAADLLADFREHADAYTPAGGMGRVEDFRRVYAAWTRAFELAADDGLVRFH